jgi:hypothetical protein
MKTPDSSKLRSPALKSEIAVCEGSGEGLATASGAGCKGVSDDVIEEPSNVA